jgi:hypothetical protein
MLPGTQEIAVEKRGEPRQPGHGPVLLRPDDGHAAGPVTGALVDWSAGGFRAAHACRALQTGDVLAFEHEHGRGLARLVWVRITAEAVESGFVVVARD